MPYLSSIERNARERGLEEGLIEGIEVALHAKFGRPGRSLMGKVRGLNDLAALRRFARFLKTAKTLDETREYLS